MGMGAILFRTIHELKAKNFVKLLHLRQFHGFGSIWEVNYEKILRVIFRENLKIGGSRGGEGQSILSIFKDLNVWYEKHIHLKGFSLGPFPYEIELFEKIGQLGANQQNPSFDFHEI